MNKSVFIIAEAGVNHNGCIEQAFRLVEVAADAGADAVKFQTFKAENLVTRNSQKADYQKKTTDADESQLEMIRKLELNEDEHHELQKYCQKHNILFMSTPFDHPSIDLLYSMGMPIWKIPSGEITNLPYLCRIGSLGKEIVLSTGMAEMDEIRAALDVLLQSGTERRNVCILHANTEYPTPFADVNLRAMQTIGAELDVRCGYSDHTLGIEVPIAAVAMGASVIEKHFTLDREMDGPDHRASLEPDELQSMVTGIRNIEIALGDAVKRPSPSESRNKATARKSIVAAQRIVSGELFTEENLTAKRPGTGISPMLWNEIVGQTASRTFEKDELIDA